MVAILWWFPFDGCFWHLRKFCILFVSFVYWLLESNPMHSFVSWEQFPGWCSVQVHGSSSAILFCAKVAPVDYRSATRTAWWFIGVSVLSFCTCCSLRVHGWNDAFFQTSNTGLRQAKDRSLRARDSHRVGRSGVVGFIMSVRRSSSLPPRSFFVLDVQSQ